APPLVVARLLASAARGERLSVPQLVPYVLCFAALWLGGEVIWRIAALVMSRVEVRAMEALYVEAMDELLRRDLAFFHDNFAGSLTKRALGYARRFEDIFDILCFFASGNLLPLAFAGVVLWSFSPWLIVVLLGMMGLTFALMYPLMRRRQRLVEEREDA